jgi:hypothetical protein
MQNFRPGAKPTSEHGYFLTSSRYSAVVVIGAKNGTKRSPAQSFLPDSEKSIYRVASGEEEIDDVVHRHGEQCPGTIGFHCVGPDGAVVDSLYGVCLECHLCWTAWVAKCSKRCVDKKKLCGSRIRWRDSFDFRLVKGPVQVYVEVFFG